MPKILLKFQDFDVEIELNQSKTAQEILKNLPIVSTINTWGDEIYFSTPLDLPLEDATTDINIGDVAYWPQGNALCVFFGPTPMSDSDKPVPASKVNIVGKVVSGLSQLKKLESGSNISIDKA